MNFLACDLGGTKVLLGIYEKLNNSRIPKLVLKEKYFSNEWDSFYSILDDFLKKQSLDISTLKSACFAIAGPVKGDNCKLTNLPWNISRVELKSKLKINSVELINDFAVLIYGIPFLDKNQFQTIQMGDESVVNNKKLHTIVGAGTGLGISRGLINSDIVEVLSPKWLRIGGYWYPRGGIPIDIFWQTCKQPNDLFIPDHLVPNYRGRG